MSDKENVLDLKKTLEEIHILSEEDKLGIRAGVNMTLILYKLAREIKDNTTGYLSEEGYVDIMQVLNYCRVEMQECHLNSDQDFFDNEIAGYLDASKYAQNTHGWKIYINADISGLERRYVIAHEVSHYIIDSIYNNKVRRYCTTPVFPKDSSEQSCDMLASFLLMPLENVMEYFKCFRDEKMKAGEKPRKVEFIKYLASKFIITDLQAAMSFEHVRHLAGVLYEKSIFYQSQKSELQCDNRSEEVQFLKEFGKEYEMIKKHRECFR